MTRAYIGLGSNLAHATDSSITILQQAVRELAALATSPVRVSSLYTSKPMGPQDQPDYFNVVAALDTDLTALQLLHALQQLEQQAGRVRLRHWGERTLDLDILLFGEQRIATPELSVPHPGILQRNFVVIPLLELEPQLIIDGNLLKTQPAAQQHDGLIKLNDASWAALH